MYKYLFLGFAIIFVVVVADRECPDEDEQSIATFYPHEEDCWRFYECDHGKLDLMQCPPGLNWDQILNVCNRDVNCGNLSTTTTTSTPLPPTPPTDEPTDAPTEAPSEAPSEAPAESDYF